MKLLNYTTSYFAVVLFLLLTLWAVVFYFEILDEIYDSMDDGLENQKMLVLQRAKEDSSILQKTEFQDGNYTIQKRDFEEIKNFTDSYRDTLMYMQNEDEYEPVRLLESYFKQDGDYYQLKVVTSMVEEDDLVKELFLSLLWLYFGLILSILLLNNFLHKKVWRPFYKLLSRLGSFSIEKDEEMKFEATKIEEFQLLNEKVDALLKKSIESFNSQKQFIENAAHELQTPLAISINKLELLVENDHLNNEQLGKIEVILNNLERMTRFNKSLLLLSKIENKQFIEAQVLNFNVITRQIAVEYEDLAAHKNIQINILDNFVLEYKMNKDLSTILLSNLIKNALIHGSPGSTVDIEILEDQILIRNTGGNIPLAKNKIFSRFQKAGASKKSTGLGLAISKAIADRFGLGLTYEFRHQHVFKIHFK